MTDEQRQLELARAIAKKIELEKPFKKELSVFFRAVIRDFKEQYKKSGYVSSPLLMQARLSGILQKHMKRTAKEFQDTTRKKLMAQFQGIKFDSMLAAEIDAVNRADIARTSDQQSEIILKTESKRLSAAVAAVISAALLNDEPTETEMIADRAAEKLNAQVDGRAGVVALTETQYAAEQSKFNEATALSVVTTVAIAGAALANRQSYKTWSSILDDVVRDSHAVADGQRRKLKDPFTIGGYAMNMPRDTTYGAPAKEIANCRCSAEYSFGDPE